MATISAGFTTALRESLSILWGHTPVAGHTSSLTSPRVPYCRQRLDNSDVIVTLRHAYYCNF